MSFLFEKFDTLRIDIKNSDCKTGSFDLYLYLDNSTTLYEITLYYCVKYGCVDPIKRVNIITKNSSYDNFIKNGEKKLELEAELGLESELELELGLESELGSERKNKIIKEIKELWNKQSNIHISNFLIAHSYSESDNRLFSNIMSTFCKKFL
jgi:hypothetical protein